MDFLYILMFPSFSERHKKQCLLCEVLMFNEKGLCDDSLADTRREEVCKWGGVLTQARQLNQVSLEKW